MIIETLMDHSSETHITEAFYNALKLVGDMEVKPVYAESWFDDLYDSGYGPEDKTQIDESWIDDSDDLDDLDEAA
jgi:hypothetical protein